MAERQQLGTDRELVDPHARVETEDKPRHASGLRDRYLNIDFQAIAWQDDDAASDLLDIGKLLRGDRAFMDSPPLVANADVVDAVEGRPNEPEYASTGEHGGDCEVPGSRPAIGPGLRNRGNAYERRCEHDEGATLHRHLDPRETRNDVRRPPGLRGQQRQPRVQVGRYRGKGPHLQT